MIHLFQLFVKITGYPVWWLVTNCKVYYTNKKEVKKIAKNGAIVISNHTTVYDFALMMFLFPLKTLRCLMAELLFKKKGLGLFLKCMGGIKVDRDNYDFSFVNKSVKILEKGGLIGVFPESRLPKENEQTPLPFKPSAAYIAYLSGAKVIPVYTQGNYFKKVKSNVLVGEAIDVGEIINSSLSEKENIENINNVFRDKVIKLSYELKEKTEKKV